MDRDINIFFILKFLATEYFMMQIFKKMNFTSPYEIECNWN